MSCNSARAHLPGKSVSKSPRKQYVKTRKIPPQKWVVGMTVAKREPPTIQETLISLESAGFPNPIIFKEPGANDIPENYGPVIPNREVLGNWGNFCRRAKWFADMLTDDSTKFLLVQDDVEFTSNSRQIVEDNWPCNNGPLSLYRTAQYRPTNEGFWSVLPQSSPFLGALAIVLTKPILLALVDNLDSMADGNDRRDDKKFGAFCHALKIPINVVNASLCQHTGVSSTLYPTPGKLTNLRQADTFTQ